MPRISDDSSSTDVVLCPENDTCFAAKLYISGVGVGVNSTMADKEMSGKDAAWILTSAIIIFTMQTGREQ